MYIQQGQVTKREQRVSIIGYILRGNKQQYRWGVDNNSRERKNKIKYKKTQQREREKEREKKKT